MFAITALIPLQSLLFHELWVCLQHANVLLNPLCQRLDRNYGISLFKNDMVWVIAFTLSAYWLREIASMSLSYQYASPFTRQLIIISSAYHAFKIINVNIDAWRKWSPKIGILRLLLDYWHFDTIVNCIISVKRMFLQGFDTVVHGCIIYDIVNSSIPFKSGTVYPSKANFVILSAIVWFLHALVVQFTRKSTATVMVELYRNIAVFLGLVEHSKEIVESGHLPSVRESKHRHTIDKAKGTYLGKFLGPHITTVRKSSHDCKVCRMLAKPDNISLSEQQHGRGPSVVFLAHPVQLASAFSLWADKGTGKESYWRASWWMENIVVSGIVFLISLVVYPITVIWFGHSPVVVVDKSSYSFHNPSNSKFENNTQNKESLYCREITKSEVWFAKSFGWQYVSSSSFWQGYAKEMVVRSALKAEICGVEVIGLGALNKAHWLNNGGEDLVYELEKRRALCGKQSTTDAENNQALLELGTTKKKTLYVVHGNTLTAAVVCAQLECLLQENLTAQKRTHGDIHPVKRMTIILIGATSKIGRAVALAMARLNHVNVVCVGSRSRRLDNVLEEARKEAQRSSTHSSISICTDALTASEIAPNAVWLLGKGDRSTALADLIPLGATVMSFAVPCPMAVLDATGMCESSSSASVDRDRGMSVGGRHLLRNDIRYIDAGVMILPKGMQEQRQFALMLPNKFVYTCHAAALVHHLEGWQHHEVGEVVLSNMEVTLTAALKHGFSIEPLTPPSTFSTHYTDCNARDVRTVDVAIIGCGPSGLATAACILKNNIPNVAGSNRTTVTMFDHLQDIEGQVR
jgi:WAX2 C-terminal domain